MNRIISAAISISVAVLSAGAVSPCDAVADSLVNATPRERLDSLLLDAERIYYERFSPQRNEALYAAIVDRVERLGAVVPGSRAGWLRDDARRAASGTPAPELKMTLADGNTADLKSLTGDGRPTLLLFYDPDCDDCHNLIDELTDIPAVADGRIAGVAVYLDNDVEAWMADIPRMPRGWTVGRDADGSIDADGQWIVGGIPSAYLISPDNTIVLKDDPGPRLLALLTDSNKMAEMLAPAD